MDYCIDNAKSVLKKNGKSFHWAGKFLLKEYINMAAELYIFCRTLDDIADNGETNSLKNLCDIRSIIKKKTFTLPLTIFFFYIVKIINYTAFQ